MDHIGIDVHKKESQLCILSEGGELVEQRIRTTPERFADVLGDRARPRILYVLDEAVRKSARADVIVRPLWILVAEDNPINQQVALGLLRRQGHEVDVVADGRSAVEAVRTHAYEVVLMDVRMPGMRGIEATREIRRLPAGKGRACRSSP